MSIIRPIYLTGAFDKLLPHSRVARTCTLCQIVPPTLSARRVAAGASFCRLQNGVKNSGTRCTTASVDTFWRCTLSHHICDTPQPWCVPTVACNHWSTLHGRSHLCPNNVVLRCCCPHAFLLVSSKLLSLVLKSAKVTGSSLCKM